MKYAKIAAGILVLILLFFSFSKPGSHSETEFLMDTVVSVTAYGPHAKSSVKLVFERLRELDKKFNAHRVDSEISKINNAPANKAISVDPEVCNLLKTALKFSEDSDGAFDVTMLPISNLWGFTSETPKRPDEKELAAVLLKSGRHHLTLDENTCSITKAIDGLQIDLGAVAKGYAAEEAIRLLKEQGIRHAYLDLGGNIAVMGGKPMNVWESLFTGKKARPFRIGLQQPDAPRGTVMETVSLSDGYVVTSGDYERYFEEDGKRYHHILNPKTGYPADTQLKSVTVVSDNGTEADMLSTALFVLGADRMEHLQDRCKAIYTVDNRMNFKTVKPLTE